MKIIVLVQVINGQLQPNDNIQSVKTGVTYPIKTLGLLTPEEVPVKSLHPGQVGVMTCNMRSPRDAVIGDTFHAVGQPVPPLVEVSKPRPMVFAGVYPFDGSEHPKMKGAIEKVSLNDYSVSVTPETSPALGLGWRLGFLGLLHLEVFCQRLEDEYDAQVLGIAPNALHAQ